MLTDSLSAQQAHTHGRRVRHSSSDSSGSDSTAESGSSSLHSRSQSRSPEVNPDPESPVNAHPRCNNKEVEAAHSSALSMSRLCVSFSAFPPVVRLRLNSLQGVVALRQLPAGGGKDAVLRNACEGEDGGSRGRGSAGN